MGVEIVVDEVVVVRWPELLAAVAPATIVMVDGALVMPQPTVPDGWRDVRIKTAAGTFAVKRSGVAVSVVAFGNVDDAGKAMMAKIAAAMK